MERRSEVRKQEMLAQCEVSPKVFEGIAERMIQFMEPFLKSLGQRAQQKHAQDYLVGLVSDLNRKNVESIAYLHESGSHKFVTFYWECSVRTSQKY